MQEVVAAINLSSGQMGAGVLSQPIHSFSPFSLCFLGRPLVQMACFRIGFVDLIQSSSVKFDFLESIEATSSLTLHRFHI